MRNICRIVVAVAVGLLVTAPAFGQEPTDTEKRIRDLEQQVQQLQKKDAAKTQAKAEDKASAAKEKDPAAKEKKKQEFESFSYRMDGRVFLDGTWFSGSNNLLSGGTTLRAIRVGWKLTMGPLWYGEAELEFASGGIAYKDMYLQYNGLGEHQILQLGHVKAPIGFDTLMSNVNIFTMDRSFTDLWNPSRHVGVNYAIWSDRLFFKGAFFGQALDDTAGNLNDASDLGYKIVDQQGYGGAARFVALPLLQDATHLVHVGVAAAQWMPAAGAPKVYAVDFSGRPSVGKINGAKFLNATVTNVDHNLEIGAEFAGQWGHFSWLSEYQQMRVVRKGTPTQIWDATNLKLVAPTPAQAQAATVNHTFSTWYALVSYVINGQREYRGGQDFIFKGTTPSSKWGALELVARYEVGHQDDLTDIDPVKGGIEKILTLGVNYYPRKNLRFMVNYGFVENNENAMCSKGYSPTGAKIQDPHFTTFATRIAYNF